MNKRRPPRLSQQSLIVLKVFLGEPSFCLAGAYVAEVTGIKSGTLYPMLHRLEAVGWLKSEWEKIDPSVAGRPRKLFYSMTTTGRNCAGAALEALAL